MLPACGADATPLTIEPIPGPSRPGVVRMSFWMMCENPGTALFERVFETRNPWQLAFGFAAAAAGPAVKTSAAAPAAARLRAPFTVPPFIA